MTYNVSCVIFTVTYQLIGKYPLYPEVDLCSVVQGGQAVCQHYPCCDFAAGIKVFGL
jgi:hypothetical protein